MMISNSDISFDSTLGFLYSKEKVASENHQGYALSRWDTVACKPSKNPEMCQHYIGSHDTFVLSVPVEEDVIRAVDHPQNILGAENLVIHILSRNNYTVTNPCYSIKTYHMHCSSKRRTDRHWITNSTTHEHRYPLSNQNKIGPYFPVHQNSSQLVFGELMMRKRDILEEP